MKKKLRLNWLINSLIIILIVGGALMCLHFSRTVPWEKCSEVYKKYSRVEGVRATYVKDYRVNDTLTVGVTLLEATDSAGWERLKEDFGLTVIPKELEEKYSSDSNKVLVKKYPKREPLYVGGDTLADDIAAISYYKQAISHFVIISKEQGKAILYKQFDDNLNHVI